MDKNKEVIILGRAIPLLERKKAQLKGINVGESLTFRFFDGVYQNIPLLFAEPRSKTPAPRALRIISDRLLAAFGLPVVFILAASPAYERQRLIDKQVFFVVSDKFANLPMLVANERIRKSKPAKLLTPVAQYILLYHLQIESLESMAAQDMKGMMPYSYPSIALGITCLEDLGICERVVDASRRKTIRFCASGHDLWIKVQPFLINPVDQRIFCDDFLSKEHYPVTGINALAHYTMLNPDPERMIMTGIMDFRKLTHSGEIVRPNEYDGEYIIEAWKYPPVNLEGNRAEYVDKLSLAISLREDKDPRVEGEIEQLIMNMEWKG